MTDRKRHKLSFEILGDLAIALAASVFLFILLLFTSLYIADSYLFAQNIELSEIDYDYMTGWIFSLGTVVSVTAFVILFILLLGQRLAYIPRIMKGVAALQEGKEDYEVPIENNNELSDLAAAINYLSATQKSVRAEEEALQKEKEELIRSLSHDIRTPLTSIMSYSELLAAKKDLSEEERRTYLGLIIKKSEQIKELTDILLDGGERKLEIFENGALLITQLADEFESSLEDEFTVKVNLDCPAFFCRFDIRELQRIFDNLISNISKYADKESPVTLSITVSEGRMTVVQENSIRKGIGKTESYGIGIKSIKRIAHLYGGSAEVREDDGKFAITVIFTDFQ